MMNKNDLRGNLVFINKETIRNVDFINVNDRFISYGEGEIKKMRLEEKNVKHPLIIGEYFYYKVSIKELREGNIHLHRVLSFLDLDDSIDDFLSLIYEDKKFYEYLLKFNKLILISYLVSSEDARNNNIIFSEFMNAFHKQHYSNDVMVLGYFKPIQYNKYFNDFIIKNENVEIKDKSKSTSKFIPSEKFYNPISLSKSGDYEYDCLKLYSLVTKNGFNMINKNKHTFQYLPKNK